MKNLSITIVLSFFTILSIYGQNPNWKWVKVSNEFLHGYSSGIAITSDNKSNLYVMGIFNSQSLTIDTTTIKISGADNLFFTKFDTSGNLVWAKSIKCSYTNGRGIFVDSKSNIYITGYFGDEIKFDSISLINNGLRDFFIAKYDSSGKILWAKQSKGEAHCEGYSVTADNEGNVYATGYFESPVIYFDNDSLTNEGTYSSFIVKYNSEGNLVWAKKPKGSYHDGGTGIVTTTTGDIYLTGVFYSSELYFDSIKLESDGFCNVFIAKFNPEGKVIWAKKAGGNNFDQAKSLTTDSNDNVYVTGEFLSIYFMIEDTMLINSSGMDTTTDIFIAKYNKNGDLSWVRNPNGNSYDEVTGIAIDQSGNVYITGAFVSPVITFGNTNLRNNAYSNIFVAKYNSGGDPVWAKSAEGYSNDSYDRDESFGVTCDPFGNVYTTGNIRCDSTYFDSRLITSDGFRFFVGKLTEKINGIDDHEIKQGNGVNIYPNPSKGIITIEIPYNESIIEIINFNGQIIKRYQSNNSSNKIDIKNLQSGIYLVKIIGDKRQITTKFIKL